MPAQTSAIYDGHSTESGLGGRLEIEPNFGMAFLSPGDLNTAIHDTNDSLQKDGYKSYNAADIGLSPTFGAAVTYRLIPSFGLGLAFNRVAGSAEGSGKKGEATLTGQSSFAANMLTVESRISLYRSGDGHFETLFGPFAGVGFYSASGQLSGTGLPAGARQEDSSAKGAIFGGTAQMRYWFNRNVALGVNAGYRYAKSGTLKVDSTRNIDNEPVGSDVETNGKKLAVDASSILFGTQLTWAL